MKTWNKFVLGTSIGVAVGIILWILEPYKAEFPKGALALFDLVWAPIAFPRLVVVIVAFAFGFLVYEFWFLTQAQKKWDAAKANPPVPPTPMRRVRAAVAMEHAAAPLATMPDQNVSSLRIEEDEERVLRTLTKFGNSANASKLRQGTGMTEFRFERAIGSLRSRFFIEDSSSYEGRSILFKQDGRNYAAKHDLDK